jgi:subtilisin family serine protease
MLKKLTRALVGITAAGLVASLIPGGIAIARSAYLETTQDSVVTSRVDIRAEIVEARPAPTATESSGVVTPAIEQDLDSPVPAVAVEIKKSTKVIDTAEVLATTPNETIFTIMETQPGVTWGLDKVDGTVDGSYSYTSSGSKTRIYIVDTGIDATHREFQSRVVEGFDAFGENLDRTDCNGHGSHIAGIAAGSYYGVAKSATLVPVRVLDCNGVGTTTTLTDGIEWILANHSGSIGIVNMSLGGSKDAEVNSATARLVSAGFIVVSAAGNSNADACNVSPASTPGVIAVGAVDRSGAKASFSNWGSCVDILAPGVGINSANSLNHNISSMRSGTSQASPFVAGAIATYISSGSLISPSGAEPYLDALSIGGVVSVERESASTAPEPVAEQPTAEPTPAVAPEPEPSAPISSFTTSQRDGAGSSVVDITWKAVSMADKYIIEISPVGLDMWTKDRETTRNKTMIFSKAGRQILIRVTAVVGSSNVVVGLTEYSGQR